VQFVFVFEVVMGVIVVLVVLELERLGVVLRGA